MDGPLPPPVRLRGRRCVLEPLTVDHAVEMVDVLAVPGLYVHTGGSPPSLTELTTRYARQVAGPTDEDEPWRNWVVRERCRAVGFVQATLRRRDGRTSAQVAWLVQPEDQRRGLATEAAHVMVEHLRTQGVGTVTATIARSNAASASVARRLGFRGTDREQDGEQVWVLDP